MKRAAWVLMLFCATCARAEHWVTVASLTDLYGHPEVVWRYDQDQVRTNEGQTQIALLTSFVRDQFAEGKYRYLSKLERIQVRCDEQTMTLSERMFYSHGRGRGQVVRTESFGTDGLIVQPKENTPSYEILMSICGPEHASPLT